MNETDQEQEDGPEPDDSPSIFAIGTEILTLRRWIAAGAAIALVATAAWVLYDGRWYTATATVAPRSTSDPSRAGLAALAGQFGVSVGSAQPQQSPEYFAALITSRVVLEPLLADSFVIDSTEKAKSLSELLKVRQNPARQRADRTLQRLAESIESSTDKKTGIVRVSVRSHWPAVALRITKRILETLNEVNISARQTQASEERRFTGGRLAETRLALRAAEDAIQAFLKSNQNYQNAPHLELQYQRLQREVTLQTQLALTLAQSYEQARIAEVRDIPLLVQLDQPKLPQLPDPPSRKLLAMLALVSGAVGGAAAGFLFRAVRRRRELGDPDVTAFFSEMHVAVRRHAS